MKNNYSDQVILPLRKCNKCGSHNVTLTKGTNWKECKIVCCVVCENHWYICTQHAKRFSVKYYHKMNMHFSNYHSENDKLIDYKDDDDFLHINALSEDNKQHNENHCNKRPTVLGIDHSKNPTPIIRRSAELHQSSNNGFFYDEMEKENYGFCIPTLNPKKIAKMFIKIAEDRTWRKKMQKNAKIAYEKHFSMKKILRKWTKVLMNK